MSKEPLQIKKRGEDGYKMITVRLEEETLIAIDRIAGKTNRSRNQIINMILCHGVENIEIV